MNHQEIISLIQALIVGDALLSAVVSDPLSTHCSWGEKVAIRPVAIKGKACYQLTNVVNNKAFHRNIEKAACVETFEELLTLFRQAQLFSTDADYHLVQRGADFVCKKRSPTHQPATTAHDRQKLHLLPEGRPDPYLIGLGLMSATGKVIAAKAHKFRQINRFLELVTQTLPDNEPLHIVDLGCGKAYLTFALYHYLAEIRQLPVQLTGVDRRADVIADCRKLATKLGYQNLTFSQEDIATYQPTQKIDVVVSLHACDTATDDALAKGVEWNARYIFAAPCCQHEVYSQLESHVLSALLRHGIVKERFAALVTDTARAELLSAMGYDTAIIEFIDLEHSPKNLLIRAVKDPSPQRQRKAWESYCAMKETLHITPKLEHLCPPPEGREQP